VLGFVRRLFSVLVFVLVLVLAGLPVVPPAFAATPTPVASLTVPGSVLIGESFTVSVTFDNAASDATGYGPYLDLFLPVQGADGDPTTDPVEAPDGVTYAGSATYLGVGVNVIELTLACDGSDVHPFTGLPITCPAGVGIGDELLVIELPFGSFTPTQPPATVDVAVELSNLANLGVALPIYAAAGFRYGADPLDNPSTDPPIIQAAPVDSEVTPTLVSLSKSYLGPENETATGPNFPRTWELELTVAEGQILTDVALTDLLPDNVAFLSASVSPAGSITVTPPVGIASAAPNNVIVAEIDELVGTGGVSATLSIEFFVPEFDADSAPVLSPVTGASTLSRNFGTVTGSWDPIDPRDPITAVEIDSGSPLHTLIDRSLAIQKSVAIVDDVGFSGATPGDTLEWTLAFQVSDFFVFEDLAISDILSDGQRIDTTFTPVLSFDDVQGSVSGFDLSDYLTVAVDTACDGLGEIAYDIDLSAAAAAALPDTGGRLTGGLVNDPNDGATTGIITFRTVIDDSYRCVDDGQAVDSGDSISNSVVISGAVVSGGTPTGSTVTDNSGASVTIVAPSLAKTVYARNGDIADTGPQFAAGDTITYRLQATLPITNFEDVFLVDYLPLPVLEATEVTDTSRLTTTAPSADPPPAGAVSFGPNETLADIAGGPGSPPTLTVDAAGNSLTFEFSPNIQDQDGQAAATIDLLFTVTLTDQPFADGLFLTNQARLIYSNSFADSNVNDEIVQFELTNPALDITKGAVAVDGNGELTGPVGPGGAWSTATTPRFDGTVTSDDLTSESVGTDVSGAWTGDIIAYALVVENTGSGLNGVFDVTVSDTIPVGMVVPDPGGVQVQVHNGAGVALPFTGDLFAGGITLTDPDPQTGSLSAFDETSGTNVAVITYLLEVGDAGMDEALVNTATLDNYASAPGGPSYPPVSDDATVTVDTPVVVKTLTSTSAAHTGATDATIGEQATYEVTVTIPPSTTDDVVLRDTLPIGMAFVSFDSLTADPSVNSSVGTFADILAGLDADDVSLSGRQVDVDLGTVSNSSASPATLTFTFTASMLNVSENQDTVSANNRRNIAQLRVDGSVLDQDQSAGLRIVEPALTVSKDASATVADAGDTVTYTVVVSHPNGTRRADAFNVELADLVPDGMTYVPGSLTHDSGLAPDTLDDSGAPTLTVTWDVFEVDETATLSYQAIVDADAALVAGSGITNTVDVTWTSLPGDDPSSSPYTDGDVQRTGDDGPGGALDDYATSDSAALDPVPSTVAKEFVEGDFAHTSGSDLTIGETATYQLTVTLPEGDIGNVTITDVIPSGLAYVGNSVTVNAAGFGGTLGSPQVNLDPAGGSSGDNLVLTFDGDTGDGSGPGVSSDPTDGTTGTTFIITYDLRVLDVAGNSRGDQLVNSATVTVAGSSSDPDSATVTLVEPDVTITKSFDPDEAAANDATTVTLTVTNDGNSDAFDLEVTDVLDGDVFTDVTLGTTAAGWTSSVGPSGADTQVQFAFAGPFAPGATATFTFDATLVGNLHVENDVPGTHTNTATVTSRSAPDGASDETREYSDDGDADLELIVPDLVTVKTGPDTVAPGEVFTYTITVTNVGARDAAGITIIDELPVSSLLSYVSSDPVGVFDPSGGANGTVTWTVPALAAGDQIVVEVTLEVDAIVPAGAFGTQFTNTADAQHDGSNGPDPTPDNNEDEHTVELGSTIDVAVTKNASVAEVSTGDTYTYDITVANVGNEDVVNITVIDTLPDGVTFVSATGGGTHEDGVVTWLGLDLLADADTNPSVTYTVEVTVDATVPAGLDELTNTATVETAGDNNEDNDTATADTVLNAAPALTVTKTDDAGGGLVAPGETITYTIQVTNTGDQGATGVTIVDTLPDEVTFTDAPSGVGTPAGIHSAGEVTWEFPDELAAGADFVVTLVVTVNAAIPAGLTEIVNSAVATDDGANSVDPATDSDDVTTRLNVTELTKSLIATSAGHTGGADLAIGEVATYELTVTLPEGDIGDVVVTDLIPAGMAYVGGTVAVDVTGFAGSLGDPTVTLDPDGGTSGQPLIISFNGPAPANDGVSVDQDSDPDTAQFRITFDVVLLDVPGNVAGDNRTNTAIVNVDGTDFASNDVTVSVVEPDVEITKTFGYPDAHPDDAAGSAAANDTVTVTLTVTNNSGVDAFDLEIVDLLDGNIFTSVVLQVVPPGWTGSSVAVGSDFEVTFVGGELADGATAELVFAAVLAGDVSVPGSHTNTAAVTWQSLPGDPDHQRDYGPVSGSDTVIFSAPDLRVVKVVDGAVEVTPGDIVTYTITVHNDGGRQAAGVVLTDVLPDETSFDSASDGGTLDGDEVTWPAFDLAAGDSREFTLTLVIDDPVSAGANVLTNTATAVDDGTRGDDPTPDNNADTANVTLDAFVDLAVAKSADVVTVAPGGTITYTLTVTSLGNEGAVGIELTDNLSAYVSFVSASAGGTESGGVVTWPTFDLDGATGAVTSATFTVTVEVQATVPAGLNAVANTATVAHPDDFDPGNNTDGASVTLDAAPDLTVTKTSGQDTTTVGSVLNYTIVVSNVGNQGATGVTVIDTLPDGLTFVSAPEGGSHAAGTVTWNLLPELEAGDSVTLTLTASVDDPLPAGTTSLINAVTVSDDGSNGPDPTPDDNADSDTVVTGADLSVTKAIVGGFVRGTDVVYEIVVTNAGPETVGMMSLVDTLPAGLSAPSFTPDIGSYDEGTSTWSGFALAPGESIVMTLTAVVSLSAPNEVTNEVTVMPLDHADPDSGNNTAITTDTVNAQVDLTLDKQLVTFDEAGRTATYSLVVSNNGPSNATGVVLTDPLAGGLTVISATGSGWGCATGGSTVNCALSGVMAPGATTTVSLVVSIATSLTGTLVNTATVSSNEVELDDSNNVSSASFELPNNPSGATALRRQIPRTGMPVLWLVASAVLAVGVGLLLTRWANVISRRRHPR